MYKIYVYINVHNIYIYRYIYLEILFSILRYRSLLFKKAKGAIRKAKGAIRTAVKKMVEFVFFYLYLAYSLLTCSECSAELGLFSSIG